MVILMIAGRNLVCSYAELWVRISRWVKNKKFLVFSGFLGSQHRKDGIRSFSYKGQNFSIETFMRELEPIFLGRKCFYLRVTRN